MLLPLGRALPLTLCLFVCLFVLAMSFPFLVALGLFLTQVAAMMDPLPSALSKCRIPLKFYSLSSFKSRILCYSLSSFKSRILCVHPSFKEWRVLKIRHDKESKERYLLLLYLLIDSEACSLEKSVHFFPQLCNCFKVPPSPPLNHCNRGVFS